MKTDFDEKRVNESFIRFQERRHDGKYYNQSSNRLRVSRQVNDNHYQINNINEVLILNTLYQKALTSRELFDVLKAQMSEGIVKYSFYNLLDKKLIKRNIQNGKYEYELTDMAIIIVEVIRACL